MKCKTCKFYEPDQRPDAKGKMVKSSMGVCQRYPGTTMVTDIDWCGEHKAKKK